MRSRRGPLWCPALSRRTAVTTAALLGVVHVVPQVAGWKLKQPWTIRDWCEEVDDPRWPFAYAKEVGDTEEAKGLSASNNQYLGHECVRYGANTICNICEDFVCGNDLNVDRSTASDFENEAFISAQSGGDITVCHDQLQGMNYSFLPRNVPTVSSAPYGVGSSVTHRNDYGRADRVCVTLSGGKCILPGNRSNGDTAVQIDVSGEADLTNEDFNHCVTRCWGAHVNYRPFPKERFSDTYSNYYDYAGWEYYKDDVQQQGRTFTVAGSGFEGYVDGDIAMARFNRPHGLAVDYDGYVYVADTHNHVIRKIDPYEGVVSTVAGDGVPGYADGRYDRARLTNPTDVALYYDWWTNYTALDSYFPDGSPPELSDDPNRPAGVLVLVVADTDNHRIRKVVNGYVYTLAGNKGKAPQSGYADGAPENAMFAAPTGIAADSDGTLFVADTYNHLIRQIDSEAYTITLAGTIKQVELAPGCRDPCMQGQPGTMDAGLSDSKFYFPTDVAVGHNNTVVVTDNHRIRMVTRRNRDAYIQGVLSRNRVVTIAGTHEHGKHDDVGELSTFNGPQSLFMAHDGNIYVADSTNCRIRRVSHADHVAPDIQCSTKATQVLRPSGCASYDPPTDVLGDKATAKTKNIFYNYDNKPNGRRIKNCQGAPPDHEGIQFTGLPEGPRNGTTTEGFELDETFDRGTIIKVRCPGGCANDESPVYGGADMPVEGSPHYTDESSVCRAAIHAGYLTNEGGLVAIRIRNTGDYNLANTTQNGVTTEPALVAYRSFQIEEYPTYMWEVQTIAGVPTANLMEYDQCFSEDAQPPQDAAFNLPMGVTIYQNSSTSKTNTIYVSDAIGNRIRAITAVCSKVCENGGECVAAEMCQCPKGWGGDDCTLAECSTPCPARHLCTAPDTCTCLPGWAGDDCLTPLCAQECEHGGVCIAPDTCDCPHGWFDANCTTPVCSQTCGNGGNCTGPDTCACSAHWQGFDCRTPYCSQECLNDGRCVAPHTCWCPAEWSGHDCSKPVAMQGWLVPDPSDYYAESEWRNETWNEFVPCDWHRWCSEINGFDCAQTLRNSTIFEIPNGPVERWRTGWADNDTSSIRSLAAMSEQGIPGGCFPMELEMGADTPFSYWNQYDVVTPSAWISAEVYYGWDGDKEWSAPSETVPDRMVAWVETRTVVQGVYVCANGGNVTHPGYCRCAEGWVGFDCRIPVCRQGYFEEGQDGRYPYWYEEYPEWDGHPVGQGGYECSLRAWTEWEFKKCKNGNCKNYIFEHTNYFSRYMDNREEYEEFGVYVHDDVGWPAVHFHHSPLLDNTQEGWLRDGWWDITGELWQKGECTPQYIRVCDGGDDVVAAWEEVQVSYDQPGIQPEIPLTNQGIANTWFGVQPVVDTDAKYRGINTFVEFEVDFDSTYGQWDGSLSTMNTGDASAIQVTVNGTTFCNASAEDYAGQCQCNTSGYLSGCYPYRQIGSESTLRGSWWADRGDEITVTGHRVGDPGYVEPDSPYEATLERGIFRIDSYGRWTYGNGECIDYAVKGCYNNGTCIAPDVCECAQGYEGYDCSIPVCDQECANRGNCTLPNTCTCERGWSDFDCEVPLCAQECNHGNCTAPDTCTCDQWENEWYDLRGRPLYRKPNGDPQLTGYTGYDCNTPICTQGDRFYLNTRDGEIRLGGFGLILYGSEPSNNLQGAPGPPYEYIEPLDWSVVSGQITRNDGRSWQTGCPEITTNDTESGSYTEYVGVSEIGERVSLSHLCNVLQWFQGEFDDRELRINYPNYIQVDTETWVQGILLPGEGIYGCANRGSCIAPDNCTCPDGWSGYDCNTPNCRHRNSVGEVVACLNGGECVDTDTCECVQWESTLWEEYPVLRREHPDYITGYNGSDCSIPMCVQATEFDEECQYHESTLLGEAASGGEGCFRCANGGYCSAPDTCSCPDAWTGYDCRTPVCTIKADRGLIHELKTFDIDRISEFESDPCQTSIGHGNCTQPSVCTCYCEKERSGYSYISEREEDNLLSKTEFKEDYDERGYAQEPWVDPLGRTLEIDEIYGTKDCRKGYEGRQNSLGLFQSCHLTIKFPTWVERYSVEIIVLTILFVILVCVVWALVRRRLNILRHKAKIARRRSRKSSASTGSHEEAPAFGRR